MVLIMASEEAGEDQLYRDHPMARDIIEVLKERGGISQDRIRQLVAKRRGCEPSEIAIHELSRALDAMRAEDPSPLNIGRGWGGYRLSDFGRRL